MLLVVNSLKYLLSQFILRKYEHNNNKSKHGTFKKLKLREERKIAQTQKEEKYKVQERERATATRFDLAQGSHQAVEQVGKRTIKK